MGRYRKCRPFARFAGEIDGTIVQLAVVLATISDRQQKGKGKHNL
jgi:hypothetical protein